MLDEISSDTERKAPSDRDDDDDNHDDHDGRVRGMTVFSP